MRKLVTFCTFLLVSVDIAIAQIDEKAWGFYAKLAGTTQQHESGYSIRWQWSQPNVELLEELYLIDSGRVLFSSKITKDNQSNFNIYRHGAVWQGTQQADGSFLFIGKGWLTPHLQTLLNAENSYIWRTVVLKGGQIASVKNEFRHIPIAGTTEQTVSHNTLSESTRKDSSPIPIQRLALSQDSSALTAPVYNLQATEQDISTSGNMQEKETSQVVSSETMPMNKVQDVDMPRPSARVLSVEELAKLQSNVQRSKAKAIEDLAKAKADEERRYQEERERQVREAQQRREAAAQRQANQQMFANAFLGTLNSELQKSQANQTAFDARIADTIQAAQQQKQREEQARQAQQQRQREIQARQTQNAQSNIASPQTTQGRDQALREAAAAERQRLQHIEQQKKEAEQRQLVIAQRHEEEKRQKELEQNKIAELKQQEAANYANTIRAGTRVGAISCGAGQRAHIVGVLGKAQRPKHIYNDCRLQEVRYRCPSESNWQYRSHNLWQLNNACIGVGDDVVVNANCPAEQLTVQATRFSCDVP